MNRRAIAAVCSAFALSALFQVSLAGTETVDASKFAGLQWRNIGPFRGGRVSAVTGAIGQPGTFYIGLPGGGVWKTTSMGQTWFPVFDSIKDVAGIGSVQVAPSDPNIVYAGSGDGTGRVNEGNGVYKSIDAGKTWQHMGLDDTKEIPALLVDPHDPNYVLLAAQGHLFEKSEDRGVFRSTDGGQTWSKTLFVDNTTGAQNIARAFDHPEVVFATTVRHQRDANFTGRIGGGESGGPNTTIYKSTDEGVTWKKLGGDGLPKMFGRTTLAVANGTNAQRVFLIGQFGLYRSDDGGMTWRQMAANDPRIANGQGNYTSGVYVDSKNPDVVYTLATCMYRSLDGGKTFSGFKGAPGGDDPQQLWIDPTDGNRILYGGDQGATVSVDAGQTWGLWYNQATAQVYHISVDTQYPFWVYATMQDSGCIGTSSRGNFGAVTPLDWMAHPGFEFGSIVADPLNPKTTYALGGALNLSRFDGDTWTWTEVTPATSENGLRKVLNQPLAFSPVNPHELLAAFQCMMSTTDGGVHWKQLSPDLTTKPGDKPESQSSNPFRGFGSAIESFSQSSIAPGTLWAGTNNGHIQVTKDRGATWEDVSISSLPTPARADVSGIDASHHDPAEAYAAVDFSGKGDFKPYFFRTRDYGKTWTAIDNGLPTDEPGGSFARVIRADTKRAGLIFAGTESGMYVSFNDGDNWESLRINLPTTSYRDIAIHGNDLVVGTYGRGFWILDDYSPLREIEPKTVAEPAYLYKPGEAIRVRRNTNGDTPFPPEVPHAANPPLGAVIYYSLAAKPAGDIRLEILDKDGNVVRHMSSAAVDSYGHGFYAVPDFWEEVRRPLPTEVGLNRINWDVRYDKPSQFKHDPADDMQAVAGQTPAGVEGPLALPGDYVARLIVDGKNYEQPFTVRNDPRSNGTMPQLRTLHQLQMNLLDGTREAWEGYQQVATMRGAVADILKSKPSDEVAKAAREFDDKLASVGGSPDKPRSFFGPSSGPSFVLSNGEFVGQLGVCDFSEWAPTEAALMNYGENWTHLKDIADKWKALNGKDLADFNAILKKNNLASINAAPALKEVPAPPAKYLPKTPSSTGTVKKTNMSPDDIEELEHGQDGD